MSGGVIFQEEDQLLRASPAKVKTPLLLHLPHFMKVLWPREGWSPPSVSIRGAGPAVGGSEWIIPAPDARPHAGSLRRAENPPAPRKFLRVTGTVHGPRGCVRLSTWCVPMASSCDRCAVSLPLFSGPCRFPTAPRPTLGQSWGPRDLPLNPT